MNLFIKIYIILCVALIVFDLAFLAIKNIRNFEFYPRNKKLEKRIRDEIVLHREFGSFSPNFLRDMNRLLSKTQNLITLHSELERAPYAKEWFRPVVLAQIDSYMKKSDYEQAFYTYVVSTFDYSAEPIPPNFADQFITFLDSSSLYTFSNTMNALYAFGQVNLLLLGIEKVNERGKFYHKKLLTDGILASKVDQVELTKRLVERFFCYSPHVQDCLLDIFRMGKGDAAILCKSLMTNSEISEQVRYSAMRYFIKHPDNYSRSFFVYRLKDENAPWVEQMLSIQAMGAYSDDEAYQLVKSKATSRHWYVRTNAVEYLHRNGISCEEIAEILQTQDRYAGEALLYQYRDDHEMTLFIIRTIQEIAAQAENRKNEQNQPIFEAEKEVASNIV